LDAAAGTAAAAGAAVALKKLRYGCAGAVAASLQQQLCAWLLACSAQLQQQCAQSCGHLEFVVP
jgi:hypothetical protein